MNYNNGGYGASICQHCGQIVDFTESHVYNSNIKAIWHLLCRDMADRGKHGNYSRTNLPNTEEEWETIKNYLNNYQYLTVEEWALDSDYRYDIEDPNNPGGVWKDIDNNIVNINNQLLTAIQQLNEQQ